MHCGLTQNTAPLRVEQLNQSVYIGIAELGRYERTIWRGQEIDNDERLKKKEELLSQV